MRALNIAATGMAAQQLNVEVISNNLANVNTTAYKAQRAEFEDLLYQSRQTVGTQANESGTIVPSGIQLGLGVKTGAVYRINEQGSLTQTNNPLDVAIQGAGYIQVQLPSGDIGYTRAGSLTTNGDGEVVTQDGYPLENSITIPKNTSSVTITPTGVVQATIPGQTTPQTLGTLQLATFMNPNGLAALGNNLYQETDASGQPQTGNPGDVGFGTLLQNNLESSNVDSVSEITNLIVAQRSYEMNSKVITASDQMMQTANQTKAS